MKRIYYKLNMTLVSPLAIGSGLNGETDKDVILNSINEPYIPATAIAGVIRNYIYSQDKILAKNIFGDTAEDGIKTAVRIYDANLEDNKVFIINRDSVKLENKVGVDGAKFDMQAVESGAHFVGYIELMNKEYEKDIENAISAINAGEITFGGKSTRGYGRVTVDTYKKEFDISPDHCDEWLDFDMFDDCCWKQSDHLELNSEINSLMITLRLKNLSGISIREYTTEVSDDENETMPDYKSLTLKSSNTPVIPGTSWAGAFRDRFKEFTDENETNLLFGYVDQKNNKTQISKIRFSESQLDGGVFKISTRNSIDRFSAGTKAGALYTEKTYFGGACDLDIFLPNDITDKQLTALLAVLCDLDNGFFAVGGLTSIGRGLFSIEKAIIGKNDITDLLKDFNFKEIVEEIRKND